MNKLIIEKSGYWEISEDSLIVVKEGIQATILSKAKLNETELEKDAKLTLITLKESKNHAKLIGDNSEQITINLYKANKEDLEIESTSEHIGKNTKSYIDCKGTLTNSTTKTKGMIKINSEAQDSDGYQKSDALILENSKVISIPDLEIHNNQVKCSHGSTITRLDEEKSFYLQSRGLTKEESEQELIKGFYESAIQDLPENIQNKIREEIL